jgi:hypothetical protein
MTDIINSKWEPLDAANIHPSPNGVAKEDAPNVVPEVLRMMKGAVKRAYQQSNALFVSAGTGNTYTLTYPQAPEGYAKGIVYWFFADKTNTGAATLNINALGAKAIVTAAGVALTTGQIVSGMSVCVVYDGAAFRMQHVHGNPTFTGTVTATTFSGTNVNGTNFNGTTITGKHVGDGSSLTALNASNLTSGTLSAARISGDYTMGALGLAGRLSITNGGEAIRLNSGNATSDPYITFYKNDGTNDVRQGFIQHTDGTTTENGMSIANDIGGNRLYLPNNPTLADLLIVTLDGDPYRVWHNGNDGAGSGLDADLLDGQDQSYYKNASNLSSGTLPAGRLSGDYSFNKLSLTNILQITGSAPYLQLLDTTSGEYSARLQVNGNNVYFHSSTDDVTFGEVFRFELDTKKGYVNGAEIRTGTVAVSVGGTGSTSASGARTNLGLGGLATQDVSDLFYTGSTSTNTSFPIGSYLFAQSSATRKNNSSATLYVTTGEYNFNANGDGSTVTGTWRTRGYEDQSGSRAALFQRTA